MEVQGTQVGLTAGAIAGIVLAAVMKKLMKRDPQFGRKARSINTQFKT